MHRELFRRRNLPHWDVPSAAYFVTSCLDGSIPAEGLLRIQEYRESLRRRKKPATTTELDWQNLQSKQVFVQIEDWLDGKPANIALRDPRMAKIVEDSILYFTGIRYDVLAYVVMPSHMHWLFRPREEWVPVLDDDRRSPRELIMYSLKRFTSARCNALLGVEGRFWQSESYDHWVRDLDELERIIQYIEHNPVKAALVGSPEDWLFSSAHERKIAEIQKGIPIPRRVST